MSSQGSVFLTYGAPVQVVIMWRAYIQLANVPFYRSTCRYSIGTRVILGKSVMENVCVRVATEKIVCCSARKNEWLVETQNRWSHTNTPQR
jgi:hypothetical protein